ncbi:cell division protein FtsZ [Poseidonocella sedimentorum]|uniref:Cell division protein FtsZ n=1 Tax=Poseidonocella sedimentorum TaxID=871652 RepID=A0A1I6CP39_9RHOB|nr:cell division protein FtsZ [Poseidonocella sedimentorum]SFQ94919.1 cell division protein FtsZ [Poseidonocella sedimentorum]
MTLNLSVPGQEELKPRITVFGVGGAGGNAVNNMIQKELGGVDFVTANTDAQALQQSFSPSKVQLGVKVTEGLGAGARPSVGAAAAEESIEQIVDYLAGAHMCFITAGMGGGTGTGAAPIIAQAARELGVLTVGVVTKPFQFEGIKRMRQAEEGVEALQKVVDTLIIIPNQNLFRLANEKTTFTEAFSMADDVLYQGVKGVTDLMVRPGLINLDFADVRAVMDEMGKAMMGTGEASGEDRAIQAAEKAIANPLLDEISLRGAKGVLINITGSHDLTLFELDEAANRIREEVDPDANIIVGSTLDTDMEGSMRVSVVATGIDASEDAGEMPVARRSLREPLKPTVMAEETPEEVAPAAAVAATAGPAVAASMDTEPSLFEGFDPSPEVIETPAFAGDDLPPPAYQPQVASFPSGAAAQPEQAAHAAPGTPSEATLARLRAAVQHVPDGAPAQGHAPAAQGHGYGAPQQHQPQPYAQPQAEQPPRAVPDAAEKSRFGINSLINRMTGHNEPRETDGALRQPRQQPPVRGYQEDPALEAGDEKIEIPAFLRRQAN